MSPTRRTHLRRILFGEESKSSNKQFLFRRIAWRLQANAEGDLSGQARRRAVSIADDRDLRSSAEGIRGSTRFRIREHRSHRTSEGLQVAGTGYAARNISHARLTQIMVVLHLAPAIQEYILFLSPADARFVTELGLRQIAREPRWDRQRE